MKEKLLYDNYNNNTWSDAWENKSMSKNELSDIMTDLENTYNEFLKAQQLIENYQNMVSCYIRLLLVSQRMRPGDFWGEEYSYSDINLGNHLKSIFISRPSFPIAFKEALSNLYEPTDPARLRIEWLGIHPFCKQRIDTIGI